MINVTKTHLPPLDRYVHLLEKVWASGQLTNGGPLCVRLEQELATLLDVPHVVLVANGTLALQIAIRSLGMAGTVLTTPFSYVATVSSLVWEGCTPHFADVSRASLCLDPTNVQDSLESLPKVGGIVGTHVYGIPCDTDRLEFLARTHSVPLLFDAAHAFGVRHGGTSLLNAGDASVLSFHATKLFHTAEGGAVITKSAETARLARQYRNFGHVTPETFDVAGINGKMSELHAAMGLAVLPDIPAIIEARRLVCERYDEHLLGYVDTPHRPADVESNFAYYPILLTGREARERVIGALQEVDVFPRRYFSPALNTLPYVTAAPMPIAEDAADRVLCLPLFNDLSQDDADRIARTVLRAC